MKLLLELDGAVIFGGGRVALFLAIEETGSILQASKKLKMSYRAAWGKIKATEDRLGVMLVQRRPGGSHGGAELTPEGRYLLMRFKEYSQEILTANDSAFSDFFLPPNP